MDKDKMLEAFLDVTSEEIFDHEEGNVSLVLGRLVAHS